MTLPPGSTEAADEPLWPDAVDAAREYLALILAPTGNDARLTAEFLSAAGIAPECVATVDELCRKIVAGCGAIVLAEEVINSSALAKLSGLLTHQPTWSDIPVTLITTGGAAGADRLRRLSAIGVHGSVTVLERPFRPATLVSTLQVALRSRRRQYEVRKLLEELSAARDVAERASNAKDEFLAALSHELRTPLNPVLLLATEGAQDASLPENVRQDYEQIARNITLEARLIDDLLDLTRITRGKMQLDLTTVEAHAAVRGAVETTQPEIDEKRLVVELSLQAPLTHVRADPVRLQQVLWNVLKNAAKFTPEGGRICIATENQGDAFVISIRDTGVGMDESELARVFSAFAQGNHASPESGHRFGGLGLGLAISRRLMELQDGSIDASSEGPGRGATFSVRLHLAPEAATTLQAVSGSSGSTPSATSAIRRLLLVEDHASTRDSLKRLLERRGYVVEAVGSLAEARTALSHRSFDLLLSDLGLPDGSGHELMAELHGRSPIKGIALSGYGMEADLAKSRESGFITHLTKPVTVQALDAALASAGSAPL